MKYLKGTVSAPVERSCAVVTEKAYGFSCWNGCSGFSGREWVEFFPKSQIKVGEEYDGKVDIFIPYWLFKNKGIYTSNVCDVQFDSELVTM